MTSGFHSYGCTIGNQVIGTLNIGIGKEGEMAFILQQLDTILERLKADAIRHKGDMQDALRAVEDMKRELATESPKVGLLNRSLQVIDSISSVAPLVEQIRSLIKNVF